MQTLAVTLLGDMDRRGPEAPQGRPDWQLTAQPESAEDVQPATATNGFLFRSKRNRFAPPPSRTPRDWQGS